MISIKDSFKCKVKLTGEAQISQHIVLPSFHRRHLLEQVLPRDESDRCNEGDHRDTHSVVASVRVFVVDAVFCTVLCAPAFCRYAAHYDG